MNEQHAVIGFGVIGQAVASELNAAGKDVVIVERNQHDRDLPVRIADSLDLIALINALEGVSYAYICVGLPYRSEVWQRDWPIVAQNVVEACKQNGTKLIFYDNAYMYGDQPVVDEETTYKANGPKSEARIKTANIIMEANNQGVPTLIARSSDFYGPGANNSPFYIQVIENLIVNKKPRMLADLDKLHNFTYVTDAAKAMIVLAHVQQAYGQVWHLPTAKPIPTRQLTDMINAQFKDSAKVSSSPQFMMNIIGLFMPVVKELKERSFEWYGDYEFKSDKFMQQYPDFRITPYQEGIQEMVEYYKKHGQQTSNI